MAEERTDFVPDPQFPLEVEKVESAPEVDLFPEDIEREIEGLLYLGALSTKARIYGHTFEIHTLRAGEEIARDQIVSDYDGTMGQARALGVATAAACVKSIDGSQLQRPLKSGGSDVISTIRANFDTFLEYYMPVIEAIYDEYVQLELRQARALKALEGK